MRQTPAMAAVSAKDADGVPNDSQSITMLLTLISGYIRGSVQFISHSWHTDTCQLFPLLQEADIKRGMPHARTSMLHGVFPCDVGLLLMNGEEAGNRIHDSKEVSFWHRQRDGVGESRSRIFHESKGKDGHGDTRGNQATQVRRRRGR